MTKLNPMKRPRSPPQSAIKSRLEYDHSSFCTVTFRLANFIHIILDVAFSSSNVINESRTYSYTNVSNIPAILDTLPSQTVGRKEEDKHTFSLLELFLEYLVFHIDAWL